MCQDRANISGGPFSLRSWTVRVRRLSLKVNWTEVPTGQVFKCLPIYPINSLQRREGISDFFQTMRIYM